MDIVKQSKSIRLRAPNSECFIGDQFYFVVESLSPNREFTIKSNILAKLKSSCADIIPSDIYNAAQLVLSSGHKIERDEDGKYYIYISTKYTGKYTIYFMNVTPEFNDIIYHDIYIKELYTNISSSYKISPIRCNVLNIVPYFGDNPKFTDNLCFTNGECIIFCDQFYNMVGLYKKYNGVKIKVPSDVYVRDDIIYVADFQQNCIQKMVISQNHLDTISNVSQPIRVVVRSDGKIIFVNRIGIYLIDPNTYLTTLIYKCDNILDIQLNNLGEIYVILDDYKIYLIDLTGKHVYCYGNNVCKFVIDMQNYTFAISRIVSKHDSDIQGEIYVYNPEGVKIHQINVPYKINTLLVTSYSLIAISNNDIFGEWEEDIKRYPELHLDDDTKWKWSYILEWHLL